MPVLAYMCSSRPQGSSSRPSQCDHLPPVRAELCGLRPWCCFSHTPFTPDLCRGPGWEEDLLWCSREGASAGTPFPVSLG